MGTTMSRLVKYHSGFSCNDDPGQGSALAALFALENGNTHEGALFIMHPDNFMKKYLYPEDFEYWMEQKKHYLNQSEQPSG